MSNKYIVPIGVLIAAVLIIAGSYLVLNPYQQGSSGTGDNINDNESYIEETQNFIPDIKIQQGELKRNTDLQLKIGNKYRYEYNFAVPLNLTMGGGGTDSNQTDKKIPNVNMKMSGSIDIVVDRKERYNKSDAFVLKYASTMKFENMEELMNVFGANDKGSEKEEMQKMQMMNMYKEGINTSGETWLNNDGKTVKMITKMFGMEITTEGEKTESSGMMSFGPNTMIQPWMLALNENFEWTKNTTMDMSGFKSASSERYKVTGVEEIDTKIGKKKCYKVEEESISSMSMNTGKSPSNNKISGKTTLWIDYDNRILVKAESRMENLKIGSIELVDEKFI